MNNQLNQLHKEKLKRIKKQKVNYHEVEENNSEEIIEENNSEEIIEENKSEEVLEENNSEEIIEENKSETVIEREKYDSNSKSSIEDMNDKNKKRCRICYEEEESISPLIFPCKCNGSIKWVHEKCIQEWIEISNRKICPQCQYQYKIEKVCNYPKLSFLCKERNIRFLSLFTMLFLILLISILKYYFIGMKDNSKIRFLLDGLKGLTILSLVIVPIMYYKKWIDINSIYTEMYSTTAFMGSSVGDISGFIFLVINQIMKNVLTKYITFKEKIQNCIT